MVPPGLLILHDHRPDPVVFLGLLELLADPREQRHARRGGAEGEADGLVLEHAGEVDEEDLRAPVALEGFLVEGPDTRLEVDGEHGAAAEDEREEGNRRRLTHARSISWPGARPPRGDARRRHGSRPACRRSRFGGRLEGDEPRPISSGGGTRGPRARR